MAGLERSGRLPEFIAPHSTGMVLIKVAVVGGVGVGKSALLTQFVNGHFSQRYSPTAKRKVFFPSAFINDRIYELHLSDLPAVTGIPSDSFEEWQLYPGYGLRNAESYILVFDLSCLESFRVVVDLHSQLTELKPGAPIVVVGTKLDLIPECRPLQDGKEISHMVTKQWKTPYVECSAKYNWRVTAAFEELVTLIDADFFSDQNAKGKSKTSNSSGRPNGAKLRSRARTRSQSAQPHSRNNCIMQ